MTSMTSPPTLLSACDTLALEPSRKTLLSDAGSWLNQHLLNLIAALWRGPFFALDPSPAQLAQGDVCLLLSCGRLLTTEQLSLHRHNLVVHESALPHGQGWSPMTWQTLEGADHIPITLIEPTATLDAGLIYLQDIIELQGIELVDKWRRRQARGINCLCLEWLDRYTKVIGKARLQQGEASHYQRCRPADSQLDSLSSLAEQVNLLRAVDNQRYTAFVEIEGRRYEMQIRPATEIKQSASSPSPSV